eukprot:scaffold302345_cov36-Tisochrysis_lutea.AAC.1
MIGVIPTTCVRGTLVFARAWTVCEKIPGSTGKWGAERSVPTTRTATFVCCVMMIGIPLVARSTEYRNFLYLVICIPPPPTRPLTSQQERALNEDKTKCFVVSTSQDLCANNPASCQIPWNDVWP